MVKLILLFTHPEDKEAFADGYVKNLALLEKMPGILRRQANFVRGGPGGASPYYRVLEFYFENFEALDTALTSEAGTVAGRDLMNYAGENVQLLFVDVFEDNTPLPIE